MFSADLGVTPSAGTLYTDDVFSTFLYTGSGSALTINNGIDLAGKGGMVWTKARSNGSFGYNHILQDTARGIYKGLFSNLTNAESTNTQYITAFSSNGFTVGTATAINGSSESMVSWTFRKAQKFFDVVTYTGSGAYPQTISHGLGITPGLIIVKATGSAVAADWYVYHQSLGATQFQILNSTDGVYTGAGAWNNTSPTATQFTLGSSLVQSGVSYVAYLFADDSSTIGLIRCGSFTTDASGNASVTSLGWEPQFLLVKASSTTGDWIMLDSLRGWNMTTADALLRANLSNAETTTTEYGNPTATGFDFKGGAASATYVYMAIRRPNKPPTSGSQVFEPWTTSSNNTVVGAYRAEKVDLAIMARRAGSTTNFQFADRLRGFFSGSLSADSQTTPTLVTSSTGAETTTGNAIGQDLSGAVRSVISAVESQLTYSFKRAPGFFDVVCWAGTGAARTVSHNLGAVPELLITKRRDAVSASGWTTTAFSLYGAMSGGWKYHWLNLSNSNANADATRFPDTEPTSTIFSIGTDADLNASGGSYVAYLFASLPGISKIGTYTGNGNTQTINCGFAAGARFVLIKRTDTARDWYVWDTARGIVAGNDPRLSLNSTAAEVAANDSVDPVSSGFAVNQVATTSINVASATYLYFAVS